LRAKFALASIALAAVTGPVAVLAFELESGGVRTFGDAFRALGAVLLAEIAASVFAAAVVHYLKRPNVRSLDASAARWRSIGLGVARVAFWLSVLLLLVLLVGMACAFTYSLALLS
jgi:hypothetical protein